MRASKLIKMKTEKINTLIIGAGVSGLSAAYFLKTDYKVLEANSYAGGLCASFYENGFTFDCSGHFIHIKDEKIKNLVAKLTGGIDAVTRNAEIYLHGRFIPYPFQANLYYLDLKTKKECVNGVLKRENKEPSTSMPFIKWSNLMFGKGITKYFMGPYNQKLWSYDLNKMTAEWSGPFVPKPDAQEIARSAFAKNKKQYGYNSVFYYPKTGGCQALINGLLKKVKPEYNSKTVKIDAENKIVKTQNGSQYKYSKLISTQPLNALINQISGVPANIKLQSKKLLCNTVRCINIGVKSDKGIPAVLKGKHWVYMPEDKFSFYRIGVYSNVNKKSALEGCYSFYVEYSSMNGKYKNVENVIEDLVKAGFIRKTDKISALNIVDMPGYVIFDKNRSAALKSVNEFLNKRCIYSIGRYGAWEYSFIEKNIKDAKSLAEKLND